MFEAGFCNRCEREKQWREDPDGAEGCDIHIRALAFSTTDPGFPAEWIIDAKGERCTAFVEEGKPLPEVYARDLARYEAAMAEMRAAQQGSAQHDL